MCEFLSTPHVRNWGWAFKPCTVHLDPSSLHLDQSPLQPPCTPSACSSAQLHAATLSAPWPSAPNPKPYPLIPQTPSPAPCPPPHPSGRYPKRTLTKQWRSLATLLLGLEELVMQEDKNSPSRQIHKRTEGVGGAARSRAGGWGDSYSLTWLNW